MGGLVPEVEDLIPRDGVSGMQDVFPGHGDRYLLIEVNADQLANRCHLVDSRYGPFAPTDVALTIPKNHPDVSTRSKARRYIRKNSSH